MPDSVWTVRDILEKLEKRVEELEKQVDILQNRMNMAIGGITVIGLTGVVNLITNILQSSGGTQ